VIAARDSTKEKVIPGDKTFVLSSLGNVFIHFYDHFYVFIKVKKKGGNGLPSGQ
jgi:hypothetical protein